MKALVLGMLLLAIAPSAYSQNAQALLESKGCLGCHAVDKRVVGPAFQEVAAKYNGQRGAQAKISGELKKGEGHPMKIDASDAELEQIRGCLERAGVLSTASA
jgi:cytochrome c551/c552